MKRILSALLLGCVCAAGAVAQSAAFAVLCMVPCDAFAQSTAPTADTASRDDVLGMFEVLRLDRTMQAVMQAATAQAKINADQLLKSRNIEVPKSQLDSMLDEMFKNYPFQQILDASVPVYQKHLSKADIQNVVAFYRSPTGQKMINEMPQISIEAMQAAGPIMQKWTQDIMQRVEERAREMAPQKPQPNAPPKPQLPETRPH